jgi:hypothetical protein
MGVKTTIQLPSAVVDTRAEFDRARGECAKISGALRQAQIDLASAEGNLASAEANLASSETGAALGKSESAATIGGRKAFIASRDALDFARAKVRGLESTLVIAEEATKTARQNVLTAWQAWVGELNSQLMAEYDAARDSFLVVVDRALMYSEALHLGRVAAAMRRTIFAGDVQGSKPLITRSGPFRSVWRKSPDIMAEFQPLAALRYKVLGDLAEPEESAVLVEHGDGPLSGAVPEFSKAGMKL